ncbi:aldo/keto reductase [Gammaproteobacteria bacterium]|nr:aldo/keto reductase [Gammaproteobacteria bacterium]
MSSISSPLLGSAMWGEWVEESEVYKMLDIYYDSGFRGIDIATNYPINGKKVNFKQALAWLGKWCNSNQCDDLQIYLKVGSETNIRTNQINLTPSFLRQVVIENLELFTTNLSTIGIHWDHRGSEKKDFPLIFETVETLNSLSQSHNLRVGFSGIDYPQVYKEVLSPFKLEPIFQVKENLLTSESRKKYTQHFENASFIAYGINFGSVKREITNHKFREFTNEHFSKKINLLETKLENFLILRSLSELSIYYAYLNPGLSSYIIAPSNTEQLNASLSFIKMMQAAHLGELKKRNLYLKIQEIFCG